MLSASLQALLAKSVDYAGLFPPCRLPLEHALKNQAEYVRSAESWMLNSFVLPIEQFGAAKNYLNLFAPDYPLQISALGPKGTAAAAFADWLSEVADAIRGLAAYNVDLITIKQFEVAFPADADLDLLREARAVLPNAHVFWEVPFARVPESIALLSESNEAAGVDPFGLKLRTGGVTADAFPTSEQIAPALVLPAKDQLPIKFTAGLHHPLRQFRDEVKTKMHGFLNVLGAAVLAAEHRWSERQTVAMLEDEDPGSFSFTDEFFAWREWKIESRRIEARRKFVTSFGSCSFDEPREDLRALGWL